MASVQVRILQSGRTDAYGVPLIPGSVATIDRDYAVSLVSTGFASWVNPADAYDGETNFRKLSENYVLFQSGIWFGLFAGDGGANGFNFTGTRGVFTLSAAPIQYISAITRACYAYIPAGAGGLAAGWYWCVMSDDTNGEIFAETYTPGTGNPKYIASPTNLPNCTAGRITQTTAEVTANSFTLPGGSMGPNGIWTADFAMRGSTGASNKAIRIKIGSQRVFFSGGSSPIGDFSGWFQNQGIENRQTGASHSIGRSHSATNSLSSLDVSETLIDTSVDQTVNATLQINANTESVFGLLRKFSVQYGA